LSKKLTPTEAKKKLKRLHQLSKKPWDPQVALFSHQRPIFNDDTPNKAVSGTRQFGKSTLACVSIIDAGIKNIGSDCAYVDMDIEHGGKVIWKEMDRLFDEFNIPAKVVNGVLRFDNGSVGYVFSGQQAHIRKLQGLKLSILIVDEAQEANALHGILTMIEPALMRFNGRVLLLGIPGRVKKIGPWWDITEGKFKDQWGQHRGTLWDNVALPETAKQRLFSDARKRLGEKSPDFMRHWLGLWPDENNALRVYHYDPDKNGYDGDAPPCFLRSLGLDPGGVKDSEAIVVLGQTTDDVIYHIDEDVTEKGQGGSWDDSGDRVGPMNEKWKPQKRFYDWGSAHKDALTIVYQRDQHIVMEGVPSKDPYNESKRINLLLEQGRLFIKRGSKLEADFLYTNWDEDSLGEGGKKPVYSKAYKQDAADGCRCAMWGLSAYLKEEKPKAKTEQEKEQEAIAELLKGNRTKYGPQDAKPVIQSGQKILKRLGRGYGIARP